MKKLETIERVILICPFNGICIAQELDKSITIRVLEQNKLVDNSMKSISRMYLYRDSLFYQIKEGNPVKIYSEEKSLFIDGQIYLNKVAGDRLIFSQKHEGVYKDYLLLPDFQLSTLPFFPSFISNTALIDHWDKSSLKTYSINGEKLWQVDISGYGILRTYNGDQVPNEIDGDLMSYGNLLYVPLRGGQLLALDARTGEKVWMADYGDRSGFYTQYERYIYKHDGLSLIEIDAITGETLRKMIFSQGETGLTDFYALHMFWVYEDVIVLSGLDSKIVMLDRKSFKVLERIDMDTDIPASKDNIIWHNNRLYVLDLANTLHEFEREAKSNI